ncbi:uncharacterized protein LOC143187883 [Calliopsis andreniformis]|uniref:uncharacterized protein LOC143187883 n=1 Tax=Calliopsis andreniformis TaxID=337506 RepID=UPI003FCCD11E
MKNVQIFLMNQICRHLSTTSIRQSTSKQSMVLDKILRKNRTKRSYEVSDLFGSGTMKKQPSVHTTRRMTVLNKIFMQHITDMMSTGEAEPNLLNKNIQISEVKVTQDFKQINVYWIDNGIDKSDTEEMLRKCASQLRYKLTELHVIGYVPPIQFVRCKHNNTLKEIERRLEIADFGEDYEPNSYPYIENYDVISNSSTDSSTETENSDIFKISLPVMKYNVFGLNHALIMSKIKVTLNKTRETSNKRVENSESDSILNTRSKVQDVPMFLTAEEQEEQFSKFLAQRRKEQRLKYKRSKENVIYDIYDENNSESDYEDDTDFFVTDNDSEET